MGRVAPWRLAACLPAAQGRNCSFAFKSVKAHGADIRATVKADRAAGSPDRAALGVDQRENTSTAIEAFPWPSTVSGPIFGDMISGKRGFRETFGVGVPEETGNGTRGQ